MVECSKLKLSMNKIMAEEMCPKCKHEKHEGEKCFCGCTM
jgi:hypothetical protein